MAGTRLRVAVVGVGHLGRHHARLLAAMPGVELVDFAPRFLNRDRVFRPAQLVRRVRQGARGSRRRVAGASRFGGRADVPCRGAETARVGTVGCVSHARARS